MSVAIETATIDAPEFLESGLVRTALNLDELGLRIVESNWGDSEIELFLIKQLMGEIPANRRPINRTVTIKLQVKNDLTINLAEAAAKLEKKIGLLQSEGGWVSRVLTKGKGFSSHVGFKVRSATITGLQGWMMAHRGVANEVTLTFLCSPYCYSATEDESEVFKQEESTATSPRGLVYLLPIVKGSAPGLRRIVVTNLNGGTEYDWHGLIAAEETRYYSSAATALLAYEAQKLHRPNSSTITEREGLKVVRCSKISSLWQSMLGSQIVATAKQMSHIGNRRVIFRIFDPSTNPGEIKVKLKWRSKGNPHWTENEIVPTTVSGGWSIIDTGECRLPIAVVGEQGWEWELLVSTENATSSNSLDIHTVFPLPTEQYLKLQSVTEAESPSSYAGLDSFDKAGAATGKEPTIGLKYVAAEKSDTTDFEETGGKLVRTASSDSGTIDTNIVGRAVGMELGMEGPTMFTIDFSHNIASENPSEYSFGQILRYVNKENFIYTILSYTEGGWYININERIAGVTKTVATIPASKMPNIDPINPKGRLITQIVGETVSVYISNDPEVEPQFVGSVNRPNLLGTLKIGNLFIFDSNKSVHTDKRTYDNLGIWQPEENAVCFNNLKKVELRSDGCYREAAESFWGQVIPDGFLPYASPSGLEGRPSRGIIIPTHGDLDSLADGPAGSILLKATVFTRAAYHFTSEAV